jgi:PAS domain-containing protein
MNEGERTDPRANNGGRRTVRAPIGSRASSQAKDDNCALLSAVFDVAPDAMAESDRRGMVRVANEGLGLLLGVPASFLVGRTLINFVVRGDCATFRAALERLANGGPRETIVVRFRPRRSGPPFLAEARAHVAAQGRPGSIVWAIRPRADALGPSTEAPTSVAELVRSGVQVMCGAARACRVELVVGTLLEAPIALEHVAGARRAIIHVAHAALHLASSGGTIRVETHPLDEHSALVTFGDALARVPLAAGGSDGHHPSAKSGITRCRIRGARRRATTSWG